MVWKTWMLACTIVIAILVVLAVLRPEGWLDILRAVLLILEPVLMLAIGKYNSLK